MDEFNNKISELLGSIAAKPEVDMIIISLAISLVLSALMWLTYRFANTPATYQPKFAATLVSLSILSTVLMVLIQSNLALSLGMLGSLSIVRFRTNIKDPRDIGFIFWSMAIGLAAATGCYFIGFTGSLIMSVFMLCTRKSSTALKDMLLVVRGSNTDISTIYSVVGQTCIRNEVKAKNILADSFELVYEVRVSEEKSDCMIGELFELDGIDSVNLLAKDKAV